MATSGIADGEEAGLAEALRLLLASVEERGCEPEDMLRNIAHAV